MYPVELEIKDTTKSNTSVSYLYLLLQIGRDGQFHTSIQFHDKRSDFKFNILVIKSTFLSNNSPSSTAYGVLSRMLNDIPGLCHHMNA